MSALPEAGRMSLTTILLAFAPGIAARLKPAPVDDKTHPRFIAGYDAGLKDGRLELAELERTIAELRLVNAPQPAGPDFRPPELARVQELQWAIAQRQSQLAQSQQYMAAQMNAQTAMAQQAQLAGMQNPCYNQGLLGAGPSFEDFCNCVPARHDMFLRG
jgi:hypothetical protein